MPLILASGSPRRRELLELLGVEFEVQAASGVAEQEILQATTEVAPLSAKDAAKVAQRLAALKATAVRRGIDGSAVTVLAADTVVLAAGHLFGKPATPTEARAMLHALRGRRHEVITGLAVVTGGDAKENACVTSVQMRPYSDHEIRAYIGRGEPFDKAGAYAIQDLGFQPVASIEGCYANVVGLPLCLTSQMLLLAGRDIRIDPSEPLLRRCTACPLRSS